MRFNVEFRPEAFADVAEAVSYYERQRAGLGAEFEAELDQTVQLLGEMARAGPLVYRRLRRVLMQRFPSVLLEGTSWKHQSAGVRPAPQRSR